MSAVRPSGVRLIAAVHVLGAAFLMGVVPRAGADETARADREEWWALGWNQVNCGLFDQASETFERAAMGPQADEATRSVSGWLAAYEEIQRRRTELRVEEFEEWTERTEAEVMRLNLRPLVAPWLKRLVDQWVEQERSRLGTEDPEFEEAERRLDRLDLFYADRADQAGFWEGLHHGWRAGVARVYYGIEETRWVHVLANAYMAYLNAADPDSFKHELWMTSLVEEALVAAAEQKRQEEWLDASGIYNELERIYDDNAEYKKLREDALTHYRLEAIYTNDPDEDDRLREDWSKLVSGADPSIVSDAIHRIGQNYVRSPDFRKVIDRGLESVLLITSTPALKQTFEGLSDELMVGIFNDRVNKLRERLQKEKRLSAHRANREYWQKLVRINQQTIRLPKTVLSVEFMDGALKPLDEFSAMIWPAEVSEFRKYTTGEFTGVGIQINMQGKYITVFSPLEDTPAYRAGIRPGDIIVKIDGEDAAGINLDEAVERITGPPGTKVTLTVKREGEEKEYDYELERAKIQIQSVKGASRRADDTWDYTLDPDERIAYIRLASFSETTARELAQALKEIEDDGTRGLILDLRFNPGGLLTSAWQVADLLLPANQVIVRTAGRDPADDWQKKSNSRHTELPLIVLVNDRSASASEIVSGAVKDHKRGLIVGERTFGKGSVQNLIPMADNEAYLKLTTAHYYLPSGRCLQRDPDSAEWGVDPDIKVKLVPKETRHVLAVRRQNDVIGMGESALSELEAEEDEEAFDAQLETALLLMRIRLAGNADWTFPDQAVAAAGEAPDITKN
ncbi:MAG: PDZ domain-containing protein [Phycisphaerales bacterium]|nr:MAG: PDZ domain-containing protein [Phycisphaerales bacterium]